MSSLIHMQVPGPGTLRVAGLVMTNLPFSPPAHYPLGLVQALGWFAHFDR